MIFPILHIINLQSITLLMVLYGIGGRSEIAAEIGLIQATSSIFINAFSSNARIVILSSNDFNLSKIICAIRIILVIPIILLIFIVYRNMSWTFDYLIYFIVIRKIAEWICEVDLAEKERVAQKHTVIINVLVQISLLSLMAVSILTTIKIENLVQTYIAWTISPLLFTGKFICSSFLKIKQININYIKKLSPHLGSSIVIALSLFIFRWLFIYYTGKVVAGEYFTAFAIGGILGSIFINAFAPSIIFQEKNTNTSFKYPIYLKFILYIYITVGFMILFSIYFELHVEFISLMTKNFWMSLGYSMIGGVVMMYSQILRSRLIILNLKNNLFVPDIFMNILIILSIPFLYHIGREVYLTPISLIGACISFGSYFIVHKYTANLK